LSLIPRRLAQNGDISTVAREAADRLLNRAPALPSIPLVDPPARPYHCIPLRSSRKRHGLLGLPARNQRHLHQDQ
jgi:hypothetical protein